VLTISTLCAVARTLRWWSQVPAGQEGTQPRVHASTRAPSASHQSLRLDTEVCPSSPQFPLTCLFQSSNFSSLHPLFSVPPLVLRERLRNAMAHATHSFFNDRGFLYVHTPLITGADCEGAGEMFAVTTMLPKDSKGDLPRTKTGEIDYSQDFFGGQVWSSVRALYFDV
jgi:hypothetical protein